MSIPGPGKRSLQTRGRDRTQYRLRLQARFDAVNGVVVPSTLKPGQPPIKIPQTKRPPRVRTKNKCCPICGDWFPDNYHVKNHFVPCVGRNGNPQGYCWDGALDDERRIGKEIAELYCRRDGGADQDTETSTTDGSFGDENSGDESSGDESSSDDSSNDNPHTIRYAPSESWSSSQSSSSHSLTETSSLRHDSDDDTMASPQARTETDEGCGKSVTEMLDEEVADSATDSPHFSKEGKAGIFSNVAKVSVSLRFQTVVILMYGSGLSIRAASRPTSPYVSSGLWQAL